MTKLSPPSAFNFRKVWKVPEGWPADPTDPTDPADPAELADPAEPADPAGSVGSAGGAGSIGAVRAAGHPSGTFRNLPDLPEVVPELLLSCSRASGQLR